MNILFSARAVDLTTNYGDAVHVRELVSAWVNAGHRVHVVSLGSNPQNRTMHIEAAWGPSASADLLDTDGIHRFYYPRQAVAAWRLIRAVRSGGFHAMYMRPSVGLSGAFDVFLEILLCRLARIPLVIEINGWGENEARELRESRFLQLASLGKRLTRRLFSLADGFVAVNSSLARRLEEELRVDKGRVRVIPNGANPEVFRLTDQYAARAALNLPLDAPILVFVGHIGLEADLAPLIGSMPSLAGEFPRVLLLVVGGGQDLTHYDALSKSLGLQELTRFVGTVPHDQVPPYINAADIGLVATKPHLHSTPMKLFEYWSCGKAVVATNTPDLKLVEEVGGGVLIKEHLPEGWTEAISNLLRQPSLKAQMGMRGRQYVLDERTWVITASRIIDYMQDMVTP